jgi:hypothetical protein
MKPAAVVLHMENVMKLMGGTNCTLMDIFDAQQAAHQRLLTVTRAAAQMDRVGMSYVWRISTWDLRQTLGQWGYDLNLFRGCGVDDRRKKTWKSQLLAIELQLRIESPMGSAGGLAWKCSLLFASIVSTEY